MVSELREQIRSLKEGLDRKLIARDERITALEKRIEELEVELGLAKSSIRRPHAIAS